MNEMGGGTSQPANSANAEQAAYESRLIRPTVLFPSDGEYMLFVDFWPQGGEKVTLTVPIEIGSTKTQSANLSPDTNLTQSVGDLTVSMKTDGELKADQYNYVSFEITNEQGEVKSQDVGIMSGSRSNLYAVDEKLKTFIRADVVDRENLQFSVNFPKPGTYKIWFEFIHENRIKQISFVVDVN